MPYPTEHQELAYAWETAGVPLDQIALMHINLQYKLEREKEHIKFLRDLLHARHGTGFETLTIARAKKARKAECDNNCRQNDKKCHIQGDDCDDS